MLVKHHPEEMAASPTGGTSGLSRGAGKKPCLVWGGVGRTLSFAARYLRALELVMCPLPRSPSLRIYEDICGTRWALPCLFPCSEMTPVVQLNSVGDR